MPTDLVWSTQAEDDLNELFEYLRDKSPTAAITYVEGLTLSCAQLRAFPESGRAYNSRSRMLVFRNHVILYRYRKRDQKVIITKVVDGRRDYGRLFNNILK